MLTRTTAMDGNVATPNDWDDDECEMMRFLLLGGSPSGVDENSRNASQQKSPPKRKTKLSALERREKHREVVKRSYHRNKVRVHVSLYHSTRWT